MGQLSVLGSILLYLGTFGISGIICKANIQNKFLKLFLVIIPPLFLATFRYNVGYDYGSYITGYYNSFDVTLLFGPMYHLLDDNDKIKALKEAKRVTKNNGIILVSYYMNEYAIITYGFVKKNILDAKKNHQIDETYHMKNIPGDLYSMVRIDDIDRFNKEVDLQRIKIVGQDGPSNYIRTPLNSLSKEEFDEFVSYHLATCERYELLGANSHLLDILKVNK